MTSTLQIHIPQNQHELETAVLQFIHNEYEQDVRFESEPKDALVYKDGGGLDTLWQVVQIIVTIEGALQFAERAQRLERVKKLQAAIDKAGKPIYFRLKDRTINLLNKSADQIMNLLSGHNDEDGKN